MPGRNRLGYFGFERKDRLRDWSPPGHGGESPGNSGNGNGEPKPPEWSEAGQSGDSPGKAMRRRGEQVAQDQGRRHGSGYVPPDQRESRGRGPPEDGSNGRGPPDRAIDPRQSENFDQHREGMAPDVMEKFTKEVDGRLIEVNIRESATPLGRYEVSVDGYASGTHWIGTYNDWRRAVDEAKQFMRHQAVYGGTY
jgi:hypothetical protein